MAPGRLGVAAVASDARHTCGEVLDDVERFVWSFPEVEVLRIDRLWIEEEDDMTKRQRDRSGLPAARRGSTS